MQKISGKKFLSHFKMISSVISSRKSNFRQTVNLCRRIAIDEAYDTDKKSCSSYGPTRSSVFWEIFPSSGGRSSGLTGVSRTSRSTASTLHRHRYPHNTGQDGAPVSLEQTHSPHTWTYDLRYKSPSRVPAPTRSPVPMTMPPVLFAMSIRIWVLSRACPFS